MPYVFPPDIKDFIKSQMPPTHRMWWMRGLIIDVKPLEITWNKELQHPTLYFRFTVFDIDAPDDQKNGYEIDIYAGETRSSRTGKANNLVRDYQINDRISLFGHELISTKNLSFPRYFHHHELHRRGPCFETKYLNGKGVPGKLLRIESENKVTGMALKALGNFMGAPGPIPVGKDLSTLYPQVTDKVHHFIKANPDPNFACVNPRSESASDGTPKGGELNDDW